MDSYNTPHFPIFSVFYRNFPIIYLFYIISHIKLNINYNLFWEPLNYTAQVKYKQFNRYNNLITHQKKENV